MQFQSRPGFTSTVVSVLVQKCCQLQLTAVTTSNPASLSELTARLVGGRVLASSDDAIMSVDGEALSAMSRVSRKKCVTLEKPPIVALYGSCMNFYTSHTTQITLMCNVHANTLTNS